MAAPSNRQTLLKRNNAAQISLAVHKRGPISRAELVEITGLSHACVWTIVDELAAQGTLIETRRIGGSRGRPIALLEVNPNGSPIAGVWLAPTLMEIAVTNSVGEVLAQKTVECDCRVVSTDEFISALAGGIRQCAEAAGKDVKALQGVGIGVSSMVSRLLGTISSYSYYPGWDGLPVVKLLSERLDIPVYIDNDVRAATTAISYQGSSATMGGVLVVMVSHAVSAAFTRNDDLLRGAHDVAGALGHMIVSDDGPLCPCGNRGCLSTLATDSVFITELWPEVNVLQMTLDERAELMQKGYHMAISGDAKAREILLKVLKRLGIGLANTINILDPKIVYIGGALFEPDPDTIADAVRKEVVQHVWAQARGVEIKAYSNWRNFLIRGGVGLVLWQPYQVLQEENLGARTVPGAVL